MPYIGSDPSNRFVAPKAATQFSGDGSTTAFTLDHAVGSDEDILVSVDGVIQEPSVAYAVSNGTTLTFTAAPSSNSGNNIFVYYLFRTVGTVSHPSNNALQATSGTFTGDVTVDTDTLKVDSTNDRVGINTTDMNSYYAKDLVVSVPDQGGITIAAPTTSGTYLMFADGTSGNERFRGYIEYSHTNDYLAFASAGSERMRIDSTGAITKPNQPAFSTTMSAYLNPIPTSGSTTLGFDTEKFDVGSNFNTSTKTFTSPVTGKYILTVSTRVNAVDTAASYYILNIVTSNGTYRTIIDPNFSGDLSYITLTATVVADMDLNDTAYTEILQNGGTAQSNVDAGTDYTYFTGYLLG